MTVIAYAGNFTRPYCTEVHVAESLRDLGHTVIPLQENSMNWQALPRLARARRVGMFLWTRTWSMPMNEVVMVLDQLGHMGIPTAGFHLDRWFGLDRERQLDLEPFFQTDHLFSPDGTDPEMWVQRGINHHWLPPGVLERECLDEIEPNPDRWPHEVIFVGSHPYSHPKWAPVRGGLIEAMQDTFGPRFGIYPVNRGAPVRCAALGSLYATAKVVVGDSCLVPPVANYWSDRIPETLGRGGFLIHPWVDGLKEWYPDLPTFDAEKPEDAVELVEEALACPDWRADLSQRQRDLVLARDTYRHRMATLMDTVGLVTPARRTRPTAAPRDTPAANGEHGYHPPTRLTASFVTVDGNSDRYAVHEVWDRNDYRVTRELVRDKLVVDIGANLGAFSVLAAKCGAKMVTAYEPSEANFDALVTNLATNHVEAVVSPRRLAIAPEHGLVDLTGEGSATHVSGNATAVSVPAITLDEALDPFAQVDVLKMDCEGSEYGIFAAVSDETLAKIDHLVMEFHGPAMPHLANLDPDNLGHLVVRLAEWGHIETRGKDEHGRDGCLGTRRYSCARWRLGEGT